MTNPRKIIAARCSLENLASSCLTSAVMAIIHRRYEGLESEEFPTEKDATDAGRLAADMALAIRLRVGEHVQKILASEGADEFLDQLAADMLKGRPPSRKP